MCDYQNKSFMNYNSMHYTFSVGRADIGLQEAYAHRPLHVCGSG